MLFEDELELSELTSDPFKIDLLTHNDLNRTKIGFEFIYDGTQPPLDKDKLDVLLMKVHEQNSEKLLHFDNSNDECATRDSYLHSNYLIQIYEVNCQKSKHIQYKIRVLSENPNYRYNFKVEVKFKVWNKWYECYETPKNIVYWPNYLKKYALNLSHNIEDILCDRK